MVSNGYHILRRIFFPILRHKYIFYACIMFGNSVLVDKFQCIKTSCFFSFGIAMLHFLKSVYTRYIARNGLFSI